ncbi:thioredoxin family protein [Spirosoma sp. KUDC1026]|uniref:thioredoxin family protein n=1 Tax=Spirosoma sp. KUDC1026 TaxID=2745947 RepID=UPI00159BB728|nr:thioredoxin family protein [Spirosoma sp. KUDC1026]QKZ12047.1 thioredoxin family protein [Spirosoma sp. KUDC1026]
MRYLLIAALTLCWMIVGTDSQAQLRQGYTLGDVVVNFSLKNVDGKSVSLGDFRSQRGVIIVFTSNHCPFSNAYEERLMALNQKFVQQGFSVVAIMSSDQTAYADDTFEQMKERAKAKNYSFPYLLDDTQTVARAFGASRTPQVFVLNQANGQFVLEYTGAIDDNPQDQAEVQRQYVDEAVSNLLAGRPVQSPITKPVGCAIKWKQ